MRPPYSGFGPGKPNPIVVGRKFCPSCGRWRAVHDFRVERTNRLHTWCVACQNVRKRVAWRQRTVEQIELRREYRRIQAEVLRRRAGATVRRFRDRQLPIERVFLPVGPLLEVLSDVPESDIHLAALAGVSPRLLYRLRSGESAHVRIDVADRLMTAIGVPLALIYPDDEGVLRAV